MNVKVALLLLVIILASTITTVAMAINTSTPDDFSTTKTSLIAHDTEFYIAPTGDIVDDPLCGG